MSEALDPVKQRTGPLSDGQRRLVDAARVLIVGGGVQAVRLQEVADRAGVTTPAIYHHFKDRRDLIISVLVDSAFQGSGSENVSPYLATGHTGFEAVRQSLIDELPASKEARELAAIWGEVLALGAFEAAVRDTLREGLRRWRNSLITGIEAGIADGSIADDVDVPVTTDVLIALTDGFCRLCLADVVDCGHASEVVTSAAEKLLASHVPSER
jgi:AcrR family transcriptional regulator